MPKKLQFINSILSAMNVKIPDISVPQNETSAAQTKKSKKEKKISGKQDTTIASSKDYPQESDVQPVILSVVPVSKKSDQKLESAQVGSRISLSTPLLVLTGEYQNGKSTFLNCLLGGRYAVEGEGLVTTKYNARYRFGNCTMVRGISTQEEYSQTSWQFFSTTDTLGEYEKNSTLEICVNSPILEHMDLLDSPGCGANKSDDSVAEKALQMADFVIFVVRKTLNQKEINFINKLTEAGKHYSIFLNCMNDVSPASEKAAELCQEIHSKLRNENLLKNYVELSKDFPVYPVNLLWAQCALGYLEPEEQKRKLRKVKDFIDCDDENISPLALLNASNFMQVRTLLKNVVNTFFNFTPACNLQLFDSVYDNLVSELKQILKEK